MENIDEFEVNLEKVSQDKNTHSIIRLLAVDLQKNPYTTVGDWLQSLSDNDVNSLLNEVVEEDDEMNDFSMGSLVLGTLMLSRAEQVFIESDEKLAYATGMFRLFITVASLQRKGLVKAFYENMSFGEDAGQLEIARKL